MIGITKKCGGGVSILDHTKKSKKKDVRATRRSKKKRSATMFARMMALLLAVLLVQMCVYLLFFLKGGLVDETEENAFLVMSQRVGNRELDLKNNVINRWTNTSECVSSVQKIITGILEEHNATAGLLTTDQELCQDVISASSASIVSMLRHNGVTGAFLILDCPDASNNYPGFYIRGYDPDSYMGNNQDLLIERGQSDLALQAGIEMDKYWSAEFSFGAD